VIQIIEFATDEMFLLRRQPIQCKETFLTSRKHARRAWYREHKNHRISVFAQFTCVTGIMSFILNEKQLYFNEHVFMASERNS
jgi:hypothetical protein